MQFQDHLIDSAAQMGISISPAQAQQFEAYHRMLVEANKVMNLTRVPDDEAEAIDRNYLDSIAPLAIPGMMDGVKRMVDVGTGAGFPGIPLAILCPSVKVILLDSLKKRLAFLDSVIEELHLNAVTVHARAEDGARKPHLREGFDLCTARAVASMQVLCEYLLPYARVGGRALCYKGPTLEDELGEAKKAIHVLGGRIESTHSAVIPGRDWDHRLCVVRKIAKTPPAYPRKAGEPARKPIR
ncbi:MAG: 16S rRNA (guanine(527)-N(7))-methyltransferase RsmG [Clostridia bacterium]|nr:16S rRNA (guanine(527)-N(7))-methyltransferase RsmG [Clostridia bacterium]